MSNRNPISIRLTQRAQEIAEKGARDAGMTRSAFINKLVLESGLVNPEECPADKAIEDYLFEEDNVGNRRLSPAVEHEFVRIHEATQAMRLLCVRHFGLEVSDDIIARYAIYFARVMADRNKHFYPVSGG
jgi:hypothetical protein